MPCSVVNHAGSVRRARGERRGRAPPSLAERRARQLYAGKSRSGAADTVSRRPAPSGMRSHKTDSPSSDSQATRSNSPVLIQRTQVPVSRFFMADPFAHPRPDGRRHHHGAGGEKATCTARRKEAYEALHPETRHGVAGAVAKHGGADAKSASASFADDQASKTGQAKRHSLCLSMKRHVIENRFDEDTHERCKAERDSTR